MSFGRYSSDGPICPHCEHEHTPDEAFYYDEGTTGMECGLCDKPFDLIVYNSTTWTTRPPK